MPAGIRPEDRISVRIVLIYVLVGCFWVLLSDRIVLRFDGEIGRLTLFQNFKGCLYVGATGLLLYFLIRRGISEIRRGELEKMKVGEKYSALVENADDIIYSLDARGNFASINRAGEHILGYERSELLEKNLAEFVAPESRKYVNRLLVKAVRGNHSVYKIEVLKKGGAPVLLEISNSPVYLDGELIGMQGIARDLTARRAAEIKLKESENRRRELIETTNEGVLITDEQGIITFVNEKMTQMLDYDPAEILDNYVFDFADDQWQREAERKLENSKAGVSETFDFKFKRFDGSALWAIVSSKPVFENGKYAGLIAMITDITERKHAEEALKTEQKINNATLASLPGIFYFFDETGKFLRWNHNFEIVSGYTGGEIAEIHPLDFFEGGDKHLIEQKIDEVFERGETFAEAEFISKDKTPKTYFLTGKRLILDGKKYLVGMGVDVRDCRSVTNFIAAPPPEQKEQQKK